MPGCQGGTELPRSRVARAVPVGTLRWGRSPAWFGHWERRQRHPAGTEGNRFRVCVCPFQERKLLKMQHPQVSWRGPLLTAKLLATSRKENLLGASPDTSACLVGFGFHTQESPGQEHPRNEQTWAFLFSSCWIRWRWPVTLQLEIVPCFKGEGRWVPGSLRRGATSRSPAVPQHGAAAASSSCTLQPRTRPPEASPGLRQEHGLDDGSSISQHPRAERRAGQALGQHQCGSLPHPREHWDDPSKHWDGSRQPHAHPGERPKGLPWPNHHLPAWPAPGRFLCTDKRNQPRGGQKPLGLSSFGVNPSPSAHSRGGRVGKLPTQHPARCQGDSAGSSGPPLQ